VKRSTRTRERARRDGNTFAVFACVFLLGVALASCGGGGGGGAPPPSNPVPTLTSLSPSNATAGGAAFTLTVNGAKFISSSVVRWGGSSRTTTFVNSTQLTASVSATDIATVGTVEVTVFNPAPGGGTSNSLDFTINAALPIISSLSPSTAFAGGPDFSLGVGGSNFRSDSVVRWNGSGRTTTYVSETQLSAAIPHTDIATAGTAEVTVFNPAPDGGTSNPMVFTIVQPQSLAITTSRLPDTAGGKTYDFTLAASGGIPPITWSVTAGSLPPQLQPDAITGRISGLVSPGDATANFTVQASDSAVPPHTATRDLSIRVRPTPLPSNDERAGAIPISNGSLRASISPYGDQDFYAFDALAGATVRVEIFARRLSPETFLDSALEIQDSSGNVPSTCRSPDEPRDPYNPYKVIDPTPDAFDDVCRDDDIELGVIQDSLLEFQPATTGTSFIRVIDFRGDGRPDLIYDLSLSGAD